jgi:hypothetical protein
MTVVKKTIYVCILSFCIFSLSLFGDDGSWNESFHINGGSIYTEEENNAVALEEEILVFDGRATTAIFLFRNTTDEDLKVTCGFPVKITLDTYVEGGYLIIPVGKYGGPRSIAGLKYFETADLESSRDDGEYEFYHPKKIILNEANNRREFLGPGVRPAGISFSIRQDGAPVTVDNVLLERRADERKAWVAFHYKHDLHFPAGSTTTVKVHYSYDLLHGDYGAGIGPEYAWNYIIETGNTWKGPIKKFYFLKPADWRGFTDGIPSVYRGKSMELHYKENYEPGRGSSFELTNTPTRMFEYYQIFDTLKQNCLEDPMEIPKPESPAQAFVSDLGSTGSINQRLSIYTEMGLIPGVGFTADSAFDGAAETAWCENASGAGKGEYLSFRLTKSVWGLSIYNGFTRFHFPDEFFEAAYFEHKLEDPSRGIRDYFGLNNRVKELEITSETGELLYTLSLGDTRAAQDFPGVFLSPGRYRAVIRDVYSGSTWDDTCLGEIIFLDDPLFIQDSPQFMGSDFFLEHLSGFRF